MKLAITPLRSPIPLQIVTSTATEWATIVRIGAGPVAGPANGASHVQDGITFTEIGGALVVEEVEGEFLFGFGGGGLVGEQVL